MADNLGNTRESFGTMTGAAKQYQRDDYYPFGMDANSYVYSTKNEYLYNKKELQSEFGEYDYGARFYDPVIARWTSGDPLAEMSRRWSSYNYVMDNPIRLIDPDGMFARIPNASDGEVDEDDETAVDEARWASEKEDAGKAADKNADYHDAPDHQAEAEAASQNTTSSSTGNAGTTTGVLNPSSATHGTDDPNQTNDSDESQQQRNITAKELGAANGAYFGTMVDHMMNNMKVGDVITMDELTKINPDVKSSQIESFERTADGIKVHIGLFGRGMLKVAGIANLDGADLKVEYVNSKVKRFTSNVAT